MPWDGADASTSTCFLAPFFFAKRGLGGMTGAMAPGLVILEGRPRRGVAGECLCQPGWMSPLHSHVERADLCTTTKNEYSSVRFL